MIIIWFICAAPRIPLDKRIFTTTHSPSCAFLEVDDRWRSVRTIKTWNEQVSFVSGVLIGLNHWLPSTGPCHCWDTSLRIWLARPCWPASTQMTAPSCCPCTGKVCVSKLKIVFAFFLISQAFISNVFKGGKSLKHKCHTGWLMSLSYCLIFQSWSMQDSLHSSTLPCASAARMATTSPWTPAGPASSTPGAARWPSSSAATKSGRKWQLCWKESPTMSCSVVFLMVPFLLPHQESVKRGRVCCPDEGKRSGHPRGDQRPPSKDLQAFPAGPYDSKCFICLAYFCF